MCNFFEKKSRLVIRAIELSSSLTINKAKNIDFVF